MKKISKNDENDQISRIFIISMQISRKTFLQSIQVYIYSEKKKKLKKITKFDKIWDIEANLGILIALIILTKKINKMLYFLNFICFLYHVNMFCNV